VRSGRRKRRPSLRRSGLSVVVRGAGRSLRKPVRSASLHSGRCVRFSPLPSLPRLKRARNLAPLAERGAAARGRYRVRTGGIRARRRSAHPRAGPRRRSTLRARLKRPPTGEKKDKKTRFFDFIRLSKTNAKKSKLSANRAKRPPRLRRARGAKKRRRKRPAALRAAGLVETRGGKTQCVKIPPNVGEERRRPLF
jgi:hypothetical protein